MTWEVRKSERANSRGSFLAAMTYFLMTRMIFLKEVKLMRE